MRTIALFVLLAAAGCHDNVCAGPALPAGPGWCLKQLDPNQCAVLTPCAGYCLPDGGDPTAMPFKCDGGTH